MSDYDNNDGQKGPAIWADQAEPVVPALRTFKVLMEEAYYLAAGNADDIYVDAHSVTCDGDAAHFYVYRPTATAEGPRLAAYAVRTLRPYLDVEDISEQLAATPKSMN